MKPINPLRIHFKQVPGRGYVVVDGVVVVGAGHSGLAVAACIKKKLGLHVTLIERSDRVSSLWKYGTYEGLVTLLPKKDCELPYLEFSKETPKYPSRDDVIDYLDEYTDDVCNISPEFNTLAMSVHYYEDSLVPWKVVTVDKETGSETDYWSRMLVLATGVNAEPVIPPEYQRLVDTFPGEILHSRDYFSGEGYKGKKVLVVGAGNSGTDISKNLYHYNADPYMLIGNKSQLSRKYVKTSSSGAQFVINQVPRIEAFNSRCVKFVDGRILHNIDVLVFATGYCSNIDALLQGTDYFSESQTEWKGKGGLYAAGFTDAGIAGSAEHAVLICEDMQKLLDVMSEYEDW